MDADLARLQVRIDGNTSRFEASMTRAASVFDRSARSVEARGAQLNSRMIRGTGSFREMGSAAQQAGFQIGDFAVQVASGQGVLRPLIQQGTQLVSAFGPIGAVIGAAGAVVGALAVAMTGAGEEAKSFEDRMKDLEGTMKDLDAFRDEIMGLEDLRDKYKDATEAVIDLINIRRTLKREELEDQAKGLTGDVRSLVGNSNDTTANLGARFGLGSGLFGRGITGEGVVFQSRLNEFLGEDGSFLERAEAARRLRDHLFEAAGGLDGMNGSARELFELLEKIEQKLIDAAATTDEIPDTLKEAGHEADNMADGIGRAVVRASDLTAELQRAAQAMASVAQSAQDRLARAQIGLEFRGDPVGEARALAERDVGRIVADVQRDIASDIPAMMRPALLQGIKADAEAAVQTTVQAVQAEQQLAAAIAADRPARGGGRGGRAAEPVTLDLSRLQERVDKLREEQSLIGLSEAAAVRLTAAYEAERVVQAALNKVREDGREPTAEEIAQAQTLGATMEELTIANWSAEEAIRAQADAARDAAQRQEELARGISQVADRFVNAIQQADSFSDALKRIGIEMLNIAAQGLGGQGPLGGLLGGLVDSIFGAGSFAIGGTSSFAGFGANPGSFTPGGAFPSLGFIGSAKGNAFSAGNIIPFAKGGVIDRATMAPMALMGEAGPEAILPLKRGPGGRLGIEAAGGIGGRAEMVIVLDPSLRGQLRGEMQGIAVRVTQKGIGQIKSANRDEPQFP